MGIKHKNVFFAFAAVVVAFSVSLFATQAPVYADYAAENGKCKGTDTLYLTPGPVPGQQVAMCKSADPTSQPANSTDAAEKSTEEGATCAIEKVGWILCPIIESSAKIADYTFDVLANNFLRTDTSLFNDNSGTKNAWEIARNLANIMFIIAFLAIILSQVTGRGLNNYGIKKMLPRLIIAAIAVNASYYICQLIVDITNILGFEIQNALANISNSIGPSVFGKASQYGVAEQGSTVTDAGVLTVIMVSALASTAVWLILGPGLGIVTFVLVTVITILLVLMLRKALIVLLIVVSPIAFVCYLLPNTEKFFSKWLSMFGKILMVFPIVGLLFGAGQLASTIILVSGSTTPGDSSATCNPDIAPDKDQDTSDYTGNCDGYIRLEGGRNAADTPGLAGRDGRGGEAASWTLGLVAMGVAVAPLIAVWAVLKGALSAAGAIGGKISGAIDRGGKAGMRPLEKGKKALQKRGLENMQGAWQRYQSRELENGGPLGENDSLVGGFARRRAMRNRRLGLSKSDLERSESQAMTNMLGNDATHERLTGGLSDQGTEAARRGAVAAQRKTIADEISAEGLEVASMQVAGTNGAEAAAQQLIADGNFDSPRLAALLEHIAKIDQQAFMRLGNQLGGHGETQATRTASTIMGGMSGFYGGGDAANMLRGQAGDIRATALSNIAGGSMSANNLAGLSSDRIGTVESLVAEDLANGGTGAQTNIQSARSRMSLDQQGNLGEDKLRRINSI